MFTPTPWTAAAAGLVAALAWPPVWSRYGGADGDTTALVIATLLLIALPAHAGVVGMRAGVPAGGGLDRALLTRVAAWLGAALLASALGAGLLR